METRMVRVEHIMYVLYQRVKCESNKWWLFIFYEKGRVIKMKRKAVMCILLMSILLSMGMIGCGVKKESKPAVEGTQVAASGYVFNSTTDLSAMKTLSGADCNLVENKNWKCDVLNGMAMLNTDEMMADKENFLLTAAAYGLKGVYMIGDDSKPIFYLVASLESDLDKRKAEVGPSYAKSMDLGTYDGTSYWYFYNDDFSDDTGLTEDEKKAMTAYGTYEDAVLDRICLFQKQKVGGILTNFSTVTLEGEQVNQTIFSNYDLTVINVWATWCPNCIEELPDLEELHRRLPENVNIISICEDGELEPELARQIADDNGITYPILVANDLLQTELIDKINGVPTTFFVDSEGNEIGEPRGGAPRGKDGIASGYLDIVKERLALLEKE